MHVVLAGAWIHREIAPVWPYLPKLQQQEDFEREHPPVASTSEVGWDDSEYRPSYEAIALITVDPVPALAAESRFPFRFTPGSSTNRPLLAVVLYRFTDHLRLKTRILVLHGLFLSLVGFQWFLIGRRLDVKMFADNSRFLIVQPPFLISEFAMLGQILIWIQEADHSNSLSYTPELIARVCVSIALLVWVWWGLVALWQFAAKLKRRNQKRI
jgi:hypothetical protein